MKVCTRCHNLVQDNEAFCTRCGNTNFTQQPNQQSQQMQQGQQMRLRQQRPNNMGQGQQMQNPQRPAGQMQRPNNMRPAQPNQQQRQPGQGQPGQNMQRPGGQMQRPSNMGQPQPQQPFMDMQDQNNMFMDEPPKKKGLLGLKKDKKGGQNTQQFAGQQDFVDNTQNQFNDQFSSPTQNLVNSQDGSSIKDWILTFVCLMVPFLNIIVIVKGIINKSGPAYKRNFYIAYVLYIVIATVLAILLSSVLGAVIGGMIMQ